MYVPTWVASICGIEFIYIDMEHQGENQQRQQNLDEKIHGNGIRELIYSDECTPERLRDFYDSIADEYDEVSKITLK